MEMFADSYAEAASYFPWKDDYALTPDQYLEQLRKIKQAVSVPVIEIGAKEFMCVGALPPFDHPHVFLDIGSDAEIICPYCSTLFHYDPALKATESDPPTCVFVAIERGDIRSH